MGYLNSLNAGLNDDITHFPQWEHQLASVLTCIEHLGE